MRRSLGVAIGLLLALARTAPGAESDSRIVKGKFEAGLSGWVVTGDVHLETNPIVKGAASALIGPGSGSISQRIETGNGNPLTVSAILQPSRTNGWMLTIRFLDPQGRELMRVDSMHDMKPGGQKPLKLSHYLQTHPLTKWVEILISKDSSVGTLRVDEVGLSMEDENAADLKSTCDLDRAMDPFWLGTNVYDEAVLLLSHDGHPATGRLMFQPSRIIAVEDYGLTTHYVEGTDYTVDGRTLTCTATSRMTQVRDEDLPRGELKWNTIGGKQVMVTYEHADPWKHPHPAFGGLFLTNTIRKLETRAPLIIVAYGDSITHGYGESRLSHIPPFLPPWPELIAHRLKALYRDDHIQLYNSSQSGATSQWGKEYAGRMVAALNPDLVIIAFGQNDFWSASADAFADNIREIMRTVRDKNPKAEFLLVSTLRYDPAYTAKAEYWDRVGQYARKLEAMTGPGVQCVDVTAISEWVYAAKKPKDCLNDPLHPNDYFARWYAQSVAASLDPASGAQ
jgi:lysophospholipase L1-like esterase